MSKKDGTSLSKWDQATEVSVLFSDKVNAFVARRADGVLWAWMYGMAFIWLILQFAGQAYVVNHFVSTPADEIILYWLATPAARELRRRVERREFIDELFAKVWSSVEFDLLKIQEAIGDGGPVLVQIEEITTDRGKRPSSEHKAVLKRVRDELMKTGDWEKVQFMGGEKRHPVLHATPSEGQIERVKSGRVGLVIDIED